MIFALTVRVKHVIIKFSIFFERCQDLTAKADQRLTITVAQAARMLGISRGLAYEMVRQGKLPALHFGRRILVPRIAIQRLLEETSAAGARAQADSNSSGGHRYARTRSE